MTPRHRTWMLGLAMAAAAALGVSPAAAGDTREADDAVLAFVAGDYVLVGREPDGGAAYAGSARIEQLGGGVVLRRRRGGVEVKATGRLEVPSPPGEGRVLRFRWMEPETMLMTCLVASDLDNYARLTCVWGREGAAHNEPGLEAMFSKVAR